MFERLSYSDIEFFTVRHEQTGAFMADVYGRLTGKPGVCFSTLGPGATNLVTGVANAYKDAFEVAKISKDVLPKVKVVIGGPHATALPHEVASNPYVDFACYGEGEYTMLDLAKTISNGRDFSTIKGIAYKKNSTIVINPPRPFIEDLDSLPFPAYHLLPMGRFNPKHHSLPAIGVIIDGLLSLISKDRREYVFNRGVDER